MSELLNINGFEVAGGIFFSLLAIEPVLAAIHGNCGLLLYWVGPSCRFWMDLFALATVAGALGLLFHGLFWGYPED